MENIYEYGCNEYQENKNSIIKSFELIKNELNNSENFNSGSGNMELIDEGNLNKSKNKIGSKITGAVVAELFRAKVNEVLRKNNLDCKYKISENNVFVDGSHIEFDFLILKIEAERKRIDIGEFSDSNLIVEVPIYDPKDVVAVLESKTYGVYTLYRGRDKTDADGSYDFGIMEAEIQRHSLFKLVEAYNNILKYNKSIKLGYMCLAEQRQLSSTAVSNFIKKTIYFLEDYFMNHPVHEASDELNEANKYVSTAKSWFVYFAECLYAVTKPTAKYSAEGEWEKFILNLVGYSNH